MPAIKNDNPRRVAPDAVVTKPYRDARAGLVQFAREKLGSKAKGMSFFFGDAEVAKKGLYARQGYIPVEIPGQGQLDHMGDPLFMRPEAMLREHLAEAASDSAAAKVSAKTGERDEYKTRTSDGSTVGLINEKE